MVDVARKHKRVVQMGTQQRSAEHYTDAVNYVKSGQARQDSLGAHLGLPGLERRDAGQARRPGARRRRLRHVLGPAPNRPFNENRFHFSFAGIGTTAAGS